MSWMTGWNTVRTDPDDVQTTRYCSEHEVQWFGTARVKCWLCVPCEDKREIIRPR